MKLKLLLLSAFFIGSLNVVYGQQKVKDNTVQGGALADKDAILELESNSKGLLHVRLNLVRTTDPSPLSAHVAGMMVYNTAASNDVKPGIYYNDGTKWVTISAGVAQSIGYNPATSHITYVDATGVPQIIDLKNVVHQNETLTILVANPDGSLSYTDEKGTKHHLDLPSVLKPKETLTSFRLNVSNATLIYKDENGDETSVDVASLVKTYETETRLIDNGDGSYTYVNERGNSVTINTTKGRSAYDIAVANGFVGTEVQWLASLVGTAGQDGTAILTGTTAPDNANGNDGDSYVNTVTGATYKKAGGVWTADGGNVKGADGASILSGTIAPDNANGNDGDSYVNTTTGATYKKAGGVWTADGGNVKGAKGDDGADGASILSGTIAPDNANGNDGDSYVNTTTGATYKKAGGVWTADGGNLKGAKGDDGADGADGASILSGTIAPDNANGNNGDSYVDTTTGATYKKAGGVWTADGGNLKGAAGAAGAAGASGKDGSYWSNGNGTPAVVNPTGTNPGDKYLNAINGDVYEYDGTTWSAAPIANIKGAKGDDGVGGRTQGDEITAKVSGTGTVADPYTVKMKFFYMPPVIFNTATPGTGLKRNLYLEYVAQFSNQKFIPNTVTGGSVSGASDTFVSSAGAPATIPVIAAAGDLYYYITYYDKDVITNIQIDANGMMTYDIVGSATAATYMNIVFVLNK